MSEPKTAETMSIEEMRELMAGAKIRSQAFLARNTVNFDSVTGKKLVEVCDCWLFSKPFACGHDKCPGMKLRNDIMVSLIRDERMRGRSET